MERYSSSDYNNPANRTNENFEDAHNIALNIESTIFASMQGVPNILRVTNVSYNTTKNGLKLATMTFEYGRAKFKVTVGTTNGSINGNVKSRFKKYK